MSEKSIREQIAELQKEIDSLPRGGITQRKKKGGTYFYHRWSENKLTHDEYVQESEVETLRAQIERRKKLMAEVKRLRKEAAKMGKPKEHTFSTSVRTGSMLRTFAKRVEKYRKRFCFDQLEAYLHSDEEKVFILYGLRRTGKTTMIRQALLGMSDQELEKAAFIQITAKNTLGEVNNDLLFLEEQGYKYVFIDEVTLLDDFIEGAALFSDIFASCGMKIVLSGTDSLGFLFSADQELYDRCILLHTTHISYREFAEVLGIHGVDEYIRYGGTMSISGENYNQNSTFATKDKVDEYVDSAIARNIQHSLRCYQDGGHFRNLQELYEKNELTNVINRVVEDINQRFTLEVLTRDFKSSALSISRRNLMKDAEHPTNILDQVDVPEVTKRLRDMLEILNRQEQSITLEEAHVIEIKEYLRLLDLLESIAVETLPAVNDKSARSVITQPGMRYAQSCALITSLMEDARFADLALEERIYVTNRILSEMEGRMLEDIVLLETKLAFPGKKVFKLVFAIGEYDMVIADPLSVSCEIYEIKHSDQVVPKQYQHLLDAEKSEMTEHRYGTIRKRCVLYRGETHDENGVQYQNVEEYLLNLPK